MTMDALLTTIENAIVNMLTAIAGIDLTKFNSDSIAGFAQYVGPIVKWGISVLMEMFFQ